MRAKDLMDVCSVLNIQSKLRQALRQNFMFTDSELAVMSDEEVCENILLCFEVIYGLNRVELVRKEVYPKYKNFIYSIDID